MEEDKFPEFDINQWDDSVQTVKMLQKKVISHTAWATVLYLYQELDIKTGEYKEPAVRLVRYRKRNGEYKFYAKFNISNAKQALEISHALEEWFIDSTL